MAPNRSRRRPKSGVTAARDHALMPSRETRPHGHLIAHQTTAPARQEPLPEPVRARCTARTYDGQLVTMDGVVTHRAGPWLAFHAHYPGWGEWAVWVDRDCCEPLAGA